MLKDGAVVPLEQPRTRSKAYACVAQIASQYLPLESVVIAQSNNEVGEQLAQACKGLSAETYSAL